MTAHSSRSVAGLTAAITLMTGLAVGLELAAAGSAHAATPALCEIDGVPSSDPATSFPKPQVAPRTITLVSDPFVCGATDVVTTMTTTDQTVRWDEASTSWVIDSTQVVEKDTRPATEQELASCPSAAPSVYLNEPPLPPQTAPVPMDLPMPATTTAPTTAGRAALVTRTFSVVTDSWKGAQAARHIESAYRDGSFGYRELAWAWQTRAGRRQVTERNQQVTVTLPVTATKAQWTASINKATTRVGDVKNTRRVGHLAASGAITTAWEVKADSWQLGRDPRTHRAAQVFWARS